MISKRAQAVAPSATLKISAKAKELQRQGVSIISLSAGEPDFPTPRHVCDAAINAINEGFHGYTMNTGTPELRESISDKLQRDNSLSYDPSQIVCTNGAKQALGFSMLAMLDEGDEVIIPAPYWVSYPEMVKVAGATPVTIRTSFENNYRMSADQLEKAITDQTKAVMLCSPSNPTGTCYTAEELETLADVLRKHPQVTIISDEIYEYIVFEEDHVGILNVAPDLKDRTVLINGFSKGFAMTGWRLGYLAAPQEFADAVAKIQSQETSAPSAISQKAGEAAYRGNLDAVLEMRASFKKRRDFIYNKLSEIEGLKCFKPSGAFYVFPDISHYLGTTTDGGTSIETSTDLCLYLIEEQGLAAVPGDAFGEPNGIRLSYASSMEDLTEAIKRLEKGLKSLA
ncbi:pyridoxal phosphate-dependent aminotransferase [Aliifodinibius salicampi]|uniref:Aminotransferase n=1 Tax=Fodinibius salicampi TaxID=1920655 RepID=A0ABT3PYB1_9BACT|nr:pyridoxal phosphate-dependent aminotransferase [Fodinibius salicampi]MCW9712847.1 pyridoxal phosphate-dependent aminotransferase [Fodinibius salicampi]